MGGPGEPWLSPSQYVLFYIKNNIYTLLLYEVIKYTYTNQSH